MGLPDAVTAVAAGERHTLCLTSGGDVWSFGANDSGQLGLGPADDKKHAEPRVIKELQGALGVQGMLRGRVIEMFRGCYCCVPCHLTFTVQAYGLRTAC